MTDGCFHQTLSKTDGMMLNGEEIFIRGFINIYIPAEKSRIAGHQHKVSFGGFWWTMFHTVGMQVDMLSFGCWYDLSKTTIQLVCVHLLRSYQQPKDNISICISHFLVCVHH